MRKRSQRLWLIGAAAVLVLGAGGLAAVALQDTVAFFAAPTDIIEKDMLKPGKNIRVGGLVEVGSETHSPAGELLFRITDGDNAVPVVFDGIPPDLFKEGQGVIAEGKFDTEGRLVAQRVLAKHDENYMPKEVYDSLRKKSEHGEGAYQKEPVS